MVGRKMSFKKYEALVRNEKKRHENRLNDLTRRYTSIHNPYKKGDILRSITGTVIKVELIQAVRPVNRRIPPYCIYKGQLYTQKMKPHKHNMPRTIQQDMVSHKWNVNKGDWEKVENNRYWKEVEDNG